MPSPFRSARKYLDKKMQKTPKPGSLMHDLHETKKDIKRLKAGGEAEVSLSEAQQTKRRIKNEILEEERKEREAALREMDPQQTPREKPKQPPTTAQPNFKYKAPSGIAGARA